MRQNKRQQKAWEYMDEQMAQAFKKINFGPDNLVKEYVKLFKDNKTITSNKIRLMELLSKWAGLNAPEKRDVIINDMRIGVEEPDDLDI